MSHNSKDTFETICMFWLHSISDTRTFLFQMFRQLVKKQNIEEILFHFVSHNYFSVERKTNKQTILQNNNINRIKFQSFDFSLYYYLLLLSTVLFLIRRQVPSNSTVNIHQDGEREGQKKNTDQFHSLTNYKMQIHSFHLHEC